MTWNLWWQFGPWQERQAGIHKVVKEVEPDILCVQESWGERDPAGGTRSQVADLAETLGFEYQAPVELRFRQRPENPTAKAFTNAIISRWPLSDIKVTRLPRADGTPSFRTAVLATADTPDGAVRVVTAHTAHVGEDAGDRLAQAHRLAELAGSQPHSILAGDLNTTPDSTELAVLSEAGLTDVWDPANGNGWTWAESNPHAQGARHPNRRLDYILAGSAMSAGTSGLAGVGAVDGVYPSDHYAVWADIQTTTRFRTVPG
jgi:endonuclease/exonuclease/phosphatase family metal-dependent hydrolase